MSNSKKLQRSNNPRLKAVPTEAGVTGKTEAGFGVRGLREQGLPLRVEQAPLAHAVTHGSFRGFGINE